MKYIERLYVFLWKYMDGHFIYKIDFGYIFIGIGTISWLTSLTIIQKAEHFTIYSSYIGYTVGVILFILLYFIYLKWTNRVVAKYNLNSYGRYKLSYKYIKIILFGIGSGLLWFLIVAFFVFIMELEL